MASPEWPGTPGAGGREGGEERKVGGHKGRGLVEGDGGVGGCCTGTSGALGVCFFWGGADGLV